MSAPTMRTTLLLTEHLGYPPISLIDDIINAVNELMYKCTQAMEKYLLERQSIAGKDYTDEIKVGIAKLETLWENSVDRSFDKLELYILRNVLQIPQELIESGSFRLRHHDLLVLEDSTQEKQLVSDLETKMQQLRKQLQLHTELRRQSRNAQKVLARVKKYKKLVIALLQDEAATTDEQKAILNSLTPVNESVKFLSSQMRSLYLESDNQCSSERVRSIVSQQEVLATDVSSRTGYLAQNTQLELQNISKIPGISDTPTEHTFTSQSNPSEQSLQLINPDWSSLKEAT
ncbi:LANO_0C01684g1_1 [Lachancea nothofagi CBS 11611]|uniref:LANO_0C01684g1_1 n=1 Tax=Lachancea nothofagi CBS 11611 TaxID=1266666 RepID=A0A1G4J4G0_9SACH|nr:LANO_0C01684g1_1 [Lachancea nothofagi CBS 11611]